MDIAVYAGDWRSDLSALTMPVEIWHGSDDPAVPLPFARQLAASLPNATLHICDGEGHFVFLSHPGEVLDAV